VTPVHSLFSSHSDTFAKKVELLAAALRSQNGLLRAKARQSLAAIGGPAIPCLRLALKDPHERVRWEAAKALSQMGDRRAARALLPALADDSFGVRWIAAEGLIAQGPAVLPTLLRGLIEHADSFFFRQAAHHVLSHFVRYNRSAKAAAMLAALEGPEPAVQAPIVAHRLLNAPPEPAHQA